MESVFEYDNGHVDLDAERAYAQEDAEAADVIDRMTSALDGLEQRLHADDRFLTEGTSENSRRTELAMPRRPRSGMVRSLWQPTWCWDLGQSFVDLGDKARDDLK